MAKSPSVNRRDVLFGLAGVLISGPATADLMKRSNHQKPEIKLLSFGLVGTKTNIKTPEKLRHLSMIDSWGETLNHHVTYETLQHRYQENLQFINQLKEILTSAESWLKKYKSGNYSETSQLDDAAIDSNPFFEAILAGPALFSSILELELGSPPLSLKAILTLPAKHEIIPLENGDIVLKFNDKEMKFPVIHMNSKVKLYQLKLLAYSFVHASAMNIAFYTEEVLRITRKHLNNAIELSEELKPMLSQNAKIYVKIALLNAGDSATAVLQNFIATLSAKNLSKKFILQPIPKTKENENPPENIRTDPNTVENLEPDEYVYALTNNTPIHMPEGQPTIINLQTKDVLGADGKQIINLLWSGIIECSVSGSTIDGNTIHSAPVSFGKEVDERETKELKGR